MMHIFIGLDSDCLKFVFGLFVLLLVESLQLVGGNGFAEKRANGSHPNLFVRPSQSGSNVVLVFQRSGVLVRPLCNRVIDIRLCFHCERFHRERHCARQMLKK